MPNYRNAPKEINPHYNREFDLLLSGEKKVAVFSTNFFADSDWPDERYDQAVKEGKFLKLEFTETFRYRKVQYIYFYYPEVAIAVERLRELHQLNFTPEDKESIAIETEIGQLLGYSTKETQAWLDIFDVGSKRNELLYPHRYKELEMMLNGQKPLARFADFIDPVRGENTTIRWIDESFADFVDQGRFIRKEFMKELKDQDGNSVLVQHLYFAQPEEMERLNELHDLDQQNYTYDDKRSRDYNIREGQLLGYTQEEIDEYIRHYYPQFK